MTKQQRKKKIIKNKENKYKVSWVHISVIITSVIVFILVIKNLSFTTLTSHANQTIVCPTSPPRQKTLQLSPCYPVETTPISNSSSSSSSNSSLDPFSSSSVLSNPISTVFPVSQTGGTACQSDAIKTNNCTCPAYEEEDSVCSDDQCIAHGGFPWTPLLLDNSAGVPQGANCSFSPDIQVPSGLSCAIECNSKPIIYLYPQKPTHVDVSLKIPGRVTVSDPLYPLGGWKQVLAFPDGTLLYKNKIYHELYYESETIQAQYPQDGFIVKKSEIASTLMQFTASLGLVGNERKEFVEYWIPQLMKIDTPYVFISILSPKEKAKVDTVIISPEPDTRIEFLAYFKPVQHPYVVAPLVFPHVPERNGFVEVEWGGTIDY